MFQHEQRCEGSSVSSRLIDLIQALTSNNFQFFAVSEKSFGRPARGSPAWHVFARLPRFLVLCLPLSIFFCIPSSAQTPLTFLFFIFTPSLSLSFPIPPSLSALREGWGWLSVSKVNCPCWHWPRSITATHSKQNECKGCNTGAVDGLFLPCSFFYPLFYH